MSEIQQTPAIPQGEMLLLKLGEVVLKGLNRRCFEDKLIANVRRRVRRCGEFHVYSKQSTIYVEPLSDAVRRGGGLRRLPPDLRRHRRGPGPALRQG